MIKWLKKRWGCGYDPFLDELRRYNFTEHLKDVIIRISALEGKSESGTVKSRLDNLTARVENLEKGEG